jgi:hypothetical protein
VPHPDLAARSAWFDRGEQAAFAARLAPVDVQHVEDAAKQKPAALDEKVGSGFAFENHGVGSWR